MYSSSVYKYFHPTDQFRHKTRFVRTNAIRRKKTKDTSLLLENPEPSCSTEYTPSDNYRRAIIDVGCQVTAELLAQASRKYKGTFNHKFRRIWKFAKNILANRNKNTSSNQDEESSDKEFLLDTEDDIPVYEGSHIARTYDSTFCRILKRSKNVSTQTSVRLIKGIDLVKRNMYTPFPSRRLLSDEDEDRHFNTAGKSTQESRIDHLATVGLKSSLKPYGRGKRKSKKLHVHFEMDSDSDQEKLLDIDDKNTLILWEKSSKHGLPMEKKLSELSENEGYALNRRRSNYNLLGTKKPSTTCVPNNSKASLVTNVINDGPSSSTLSQINPSPSTAEVSKVKKTHKKNRHGHRKHSSASTKMSRRPSADSMKCFEREDSFSNRLLSHSSLDNILDESEISHEEYCAVKKVIDENIYSEKMDEMMKDYVYQNYK